MSGDADNKSQGNDSQSQIATNLEEQKLQIQQNYIITEQERQERNLQRIKQLEKQKQHKQKINQKKFKFYNKKKQHENRADITGNSGELIDQSAQKTQKTIQVIQEQFESQNQKLQKRLSARKNRIKQKSQSFSGGNTMNLKKNFSCSTLLFEDQQKTNASAFPNLADQSTQIQSQLGNKNDKKILIDNSFLSQDPFDNSLDDISESGISISASMVHQKIQEDLQKQMSQLWAQTQQQIALMNKQRDDKVEEVLEKMAEEKCEKVLDLKMKYDIALQNLQKKPLPVKLKSIMANKITKQKEDQITKLTNQLDQKKKSEINFIKLEFEQKRRNSIKGTQIDQTIKRMKQLSRATQSIKSESIRRSSSRKTLKNKGSGNSILNTANMEKFRSQTDSEKILKMYHVSKQQKQRDLTKSFDLNALSMSDIGNKLYRKNTTGNIREKISPIKAFNLKQFNHASTPKSSNQQRISFNEMKVCKKSSQNLHQHQQFKLWNSSSSKNLLPIVHQQERKQFLEKK